MAVGIGGCALAPTKEIRTRAYIEANDRGWEITHGSLLGVLEIDFLTNKSMSVKIDVHVLKYNTDGFFKILFDFKGASGNMAFGPSRLDIKLGSGKVLKGKGFACTDANARLDIEGLRGYPPLEERISVKKDDCFYLFFDLPAPPVEEEMVMYMNDSLTMDGNSIAVPQVYFRKTVERKYRLGLFQ